MTEGLELTKRLLTPPAVECILRPMVLRYLICFLIFAGGGQKNKIGASADKKQRLGYSIVLGGKKSSTPHCCL